MRGDFSIWRDERRQNFNGVLHQQGRVLLDADWNAQTVITNDWEDTAARDIIGAGVAGVPADAPISFKITAAAVAGGELDLTVSPGRVWADGLLAYLDASADLDASAAFYSGVFGLQEIPAAAKGRRWFSLGKGVALHLLGGRSAPVADNRSVHVALTSDGLEPILQRLRDRRIAWSDFAGTPGVVSSGRSDGVRQIFLRDPDGYWVEVNDAMKNAAKQAGGAR